MYWLHASLKVRDKDLVKMVIFWHSSPSNKMSYVRTSTPSNLKLPLHVFYQFGCSSRQHSAVVRS